MDNFESRRLYVVLFGGILMLTMAFAGTYTGKLPGRFGGGSSRAKKPKQYWSALAIYYLAGIGFIVYYLYNIHAFST